MATLHCCLIELMGIWISSSENTILLHLGLVKHLFIRKSDVNWPCHKRGIIGSHHQNVPRELNVWFRMLTMSSTSHFHVFILELCFLCFSCMLSHILLFGSKCCRSSSLKHFGSHSAERGGSTFSLKVPHKPWSSPWQGKLDHVVTSEPITMS